MAENKTPSQPSNAGGVHVPAGRTLADMPVPEAKPCPAAGQVGKRNSRLVLRDFITEHEVKNYLVTLLVKLATERKKGPWREYHEFYRTNVSGDMDTMKPEQKKYCEKIKKDLNDAYFESQDM